MVKITKSHFRWSVVPVLKIKDIRDIGKECIKTEIRILIRNIINKFKIITIFEEFMNKSSEMHTIINQPDKVFKICLLSGSLLLDLKYESTLNLYLHLYKIQLFQELKPNGHYCCCDFAP